ncbi:MAG: uridine kinase family protein [Anaerolineae bacterium]
MQTERNRPLVVGIAGGSASGKSTLTARLEEALADLRVLSMHMDRYFLPVKPRMVAPITRIAYDDFNHPASFDLDAMRSDLAALIEGEDAPQVILVEGLLTLHDDAIRGRLDLRVFLDLPPDERIVRRLRRNMARGLGFDEIACFYLDAVRFRHQEFVEPSRWHADVVLNGNGSWDTGVDLLVGWIRAHAPA